MKLKLTPTRVSLLALGAFAAVVAQELARSDANSTTATPSNKPSTKQNPAIAPVTLPKPIALSQPESLFAVPATSPSSVAIAKSATTQAIVPPLTVPASPPSLPVIDVSQLPIDAVIEQSLKIPSAEVAPAQPAPKAAQNAAFKDVQGHRAQASIMALMKQGVMKGFSDGTFRPDAPITDAQFKSVTQQAAKTSRPIAALKRPKDIVTRADAATYIHRQLLRASAIEKSQLVAQASTSTPQPKPDSSNPTPASSKPASLPQPPVTPPAVALATGGDAVDPNSYTLGAGDRIRIEIPNLPEYSKEYQILANGTLDLQRIGSVPVAGLTIGQAQSAIAARYSRLLKDPSVDISLMSARPLNVAIVGEVSKPGTYALSFGEGGKFPTVTKLIREAGGMNRSADARQVIVRRNGSQEMRLNLWDLFSTGNVSQDLSLRDGDSVLIPAVSSVNSAGTARIADANVNSTRSISVTVVGEVARPGSYTIKNQSPTLSNAIREAGGIKQLANLKEVKVRRSGNGTPQTINVNLWQLIKSGDLKQDLVLQQGDTIEIPTAARNAEEARQLSDAALRSVKITVIGEVPNPGQIEVPMNTPLKQALLAAGEFTRQADRHRLELVRLNPNGSVTRRDVSIDLSRGIDENGNPLLKDGDVLVVSRNGLARTGDASNNTLNPQVSPFQFLFAL